jgi:hypothetical protein
MVPVVARVRARHRETRDTTPNTVSLSRHLADLGMDERDLQRLYRTFNADAPAFRDESDRHGA